MVGVLGGWVVKVSSMVVGSVDNKVVMVGECRIIGDVCRVLGWIRMVLGENNRVLREENMFFYLGSRVLRGIIRVRGEDVV